MKDHRTLEDLKAELSTYSQQYRHPDMPELRLHPLYDLHPEPDQPGPKWPDDWPCGESAGVYAVSDKDLNISYIGKASMNSWLAARLSSYFKYGQDQKCELKHPGTWKLTPRFVTVIPMESEYKFEAPALEEYLIGVLHPADNKAGRSY